MTAAEATGPETRPASLGRTRRPLILAVTLVAAYVLLLLGVLWAGTSVAQVLTFEDALGRARDQFVNALTTGALYALIALGYTMVYGIIELINFAHGEIFMCGSFVSWWLLTTLGFSGAISNPILLVVIVVLAFLVAMVVMGVVGVVIERLAYRRLRNAPRLAPLITAIGVSFILQNIVFVLISNGPVNIPQIMPNPVLAFGPIVIRQVNLFVIILALGLMVALQLFVTRTNLGRAMRSTAMDREAAQLMGVDINTTIALTFFIGSALAGAAGAVAGHLFSGTALPIRFPTWLVGISAASQ